MESKKINLSKSYLYGFFASMISALIYSAVIIPIYILLISPNPQNFFVYLLYTLDIWVWIWIAVSILYSFIVVLMFNINKDFINTICNFLFFIVTSSILLLSLSYVPAIQNILYRREYTFYFAILCQKEICFCYDILVAGHFAGGAVLCFISRPYAAWCGID